MKLPRLFTLSAICLFAIFDAGAEDKITLLSGETLVGRITRESPTEVTIQFQVSARITDEKTIARDAIQKVEKEPVENREWAEIEGLQPGPNSRRPAGYQQMIGRLKKFQSSYPNSPHVGEVRDRIAALEQESARVEGGELKMNGAWLSPEEVVKRRYQLAALAYLGQMEESAAKGDLVEAMNTFDQLEKEYPGARAYVSGVELARKVVPAIAAEVTRRQAQFARENEELKNTLERASAEEQAAITAGMRRQQATIDASVAAAEKAGLRWKPLITRCEKCLESLKTLAPTEVTRLEGINLEPMRESVRLVDEAKIAISAGENEKAEEVLKQATTLWAANEAAIRWAAHLADLRKLEAAAPEPDATPAAAGSPAAGSAATPAPTATPAPETTPTPTPQPTPAHTPVQPAPEPKAKPFYLTIPGALGIVLVVLVVLGIAAVVTKKKPRSYE